LSRHTLLDRPPLHDRGLVTLPGLDHRALGPVDRDVCATAEHMVVRVTVARQPDAAIEHGQLAGTVADEGAAAGRQVQVTGCETVQSGLRIHHQSPGGDEAIFVAEAPVVQ
jgi:hypothetical protein